MPNFPSNQTIIVLGLHAAQYNELRGIPVPAELFPADQFLLDVRGG